MPFCRSNNSSGRYIYYICLSFYCIFSKHSSVWLLFSRKAILRYQVPVWHWLEWFGVFGKIPYMCVYICPGIIYGSNHMYNKRVSQVGKFLDEFWSQTEPESDDAQNLTYLILISEFNYLKVIFWKCTFPDPQPPFLPISVRTWPAFIFCPAYPLFAPLPDYLFISSAGNKDISNALPRLSPSTSKIAKKEYKMQMTTEENRGRSAEKGERWSRGKQSRLETCQSQDLGMS